MDIVGTPSSTNSLSELFHGQTRLSAAPKEQSSADNAKSAQKNEFSSLAGKNLFNPLSKGLDIDQQKFILNNSFTSPNLGKIEVPKLATIEIKDKLRIELTSNKTADKKEKTQEPHKSPSNVTYTQNLRLNHSNSGIPSKGKSLDFVA